MINLNKFGESYLKINGVLLSIGCMFLLTACQQKSVSEKELHTLLDDWHRKATSADSSYFDYFGTDAVFLGTDATERWTLEAFKDWSRKFFVAGKAWSFTAMQRHFHFSNSQEVVWFEEQLSTGMGPCRGSGVLEKQRGVWKIMQYNLTFTIPNEVSKDVMRYINHAMEDTTSQKSEQVVQAQLDAYNRRDIDAFVKLFHEDAEVYTLGEAAPRAKGVQAVRVLYQSLFDQSPNLQSKLINRMVLGTKVLDHEFITGRAGTDTPVELIMIYEVQDSTIRKAYTIRP